MVANSVTIVHAVSTIEHLLPTSFNAVPGSLESARFKEEPAGSLAKRVISPAFSTAILLVMSGRITLANFS